MSFHAYCIDKNDVWYECPLHRAKTFHHHGTNGNLCNRVEDRSSHCINRRDPVKIIIDDDTIRGTLKNKRILKRSQPELESAWLNQQQLHN